MLAMLMHLATTLNSYVSTSEIAKALKMGGVLVARWDGSWLSPPISLSDRLKAGQHSGETAPPSSD
jgi:hypothetical protein